MLFFQIVWPKFGLYYLKDFLDMKKFENIFKECDDV